MRRADVVRVAITVGLMVATLGCSLGELLVREPTATPTAVRTPRATFTPTPMGVAQQEAVLAVEAPIAPTEPPPTPMPLPPTSTPVPPAPTPEPPLPTPTPEPAFVIVQGDKVNVRTGPGTAYPVAGQVDRGMRMEIMAKNLLSDWWQVCCVQGQPVWIVARLVEAQGPVHLVQVADNIPTPPPATPTPRPAPPTATPPPAPTTPVYTFHPPALGNFPTTNDWLVVQAKVWNSQKAYLEGYRLRVRKISGGGGEWTSEPSTTTTFGTTWSTTFGDYKVVNVKIDTNGSSDQGTNTWRVWLIDASGRQVSPEAEIHTDAQTLRWHYMEFLAK
jgi:hypothetical protein